MHPTAADNFTSCLLQFSELTQEIPKSAFSNCFIWSKDAHLIQSRASVLFRWKAPATTLYSWSSPLASIVLFLVGKAPC